MQKDKEHLLSNDEARCCSRREIHTINTICFCPLSAWHMCHHFRLTLAFTFMRFTVTFLATDICRLNNEILKPLCLISPLQSLCALTPDVSNLSQSKNLSRTLCFSLVFMRVISDVYFEVTALKWLLTQEMTSLDRKWTPLSICHSASFYKWLWLSCHYLCIEDKVCVCVCLRECMLSLKIRFFLLLF